MKIIENLDKILKEKGVTAYKLEKENIIKQQTITNWRKGSEPSAEKLLDIMKYLGVTPNEIFGYNEPEASDPEEKLTENEKELLKFFRKLPEREQLKLIIRAEDKAELYQKQEEKSSYSREVQNNAV